jgi:predicted RNA binding protein YcfA (HicA-like mRNA interferase family)
MAIDHIDILRGELPELFQPMEPPGEFHDDFLVVGVDGVLTSDQAFEFDLDEALGDPAEALDTFAPVPDNLSLAPTSTVPEFNDAGFPGFPQPGGLPDLARARRRGEPVPPPDSMAFYLPYHYFYPYWWGIYVTLEGVMHLSQVFQRYGCPASSATRAARLFLYFHEYFHHKVESFATRLELVLGIPAYRTGIESRFRAVFGTDACLEEALASAYAYREVRALFLKTPEWPSLDEAVLEYLTLSPPGYRQAVKYLSDKKMPAGEDSLSEEYLHHVVGNPVRSAAIWRMFPHAFTGILRKSSRVNYVISRHSPLVTRLPLHGRLLSHRKLRRHLREEGCGKVREGGAHEIWECPDGNRASLPRHRGDIPLSTAKAIMSQLGWTMNFTELAEI